MHDERMSIPGAAPKNREQILARAAMESKSISRYKVSAHWRQIAAGVQFSDTSGSGTLVSRVSASSSKMRRSAGPVAGP